MHPEFLHALARERQAELLRQQRFTHNEGAEHRRSPARGPTAIQRARRSLGTALVVAGTRILGGAAGGVELFDPRG